MIILIYGATGYTGGLVVAAARARGVPVVTGGRSGDVERRFPVDAPELHGVTAVLSCAGPFTRTAAPLARACMAAGVHYLDLAGEVAEHEAVRALDGEAAARGVMLMPGVGFGVVPTECAAALAVRELPSATKVTVAFETVGGASRGTLDTLFAALATPGFARRGGVLVEDTPAARVLDLDLGGGVVRVASNPHRADLVSIHAATGVPDIETYAAFPAPVRALMRSRLRHAKIVRGAIGALVARAPAGPSDAERARGHTRVLAIAEDGARRAEVRLRGPEAYDFTARVAVAAIERISEAKPGFQAPSQVFGPDFVSSIEGVEVVT